jgi:hypothetical protein
LKQLIEQASMAKAETLRSHARSAATQLRSGTGAEHRREDGAGGGWQQRLDALPQLVRQESLHQG